MDRGVEVSVGKEGVRDLPPSLLDTPVQAVLCRLADVQPVDDQWGEIALSFFSGWHTAFLLQILLEDRLGSESSCW